MDLARGLLELLDSKPFCYATLKQIEGYASDLLRSRPSKLPPEQVGLYVVQQITYAIAAEIEAADGNSARHNFIESKFKVRLRAAIAALDAPVDTITALASLIAHYNSDIPRDSAATAKSSSL
jgi:hypothetical protein